MLKLFQVARLTATLVTARLNIKSERGATAVEYGLMVALIAAVIIAAVWAIGQNSRDAFECVADGMENTATAAAC